jgi:hypothetical protein
MDKVRKPSNSECYTTSSEPFRISLEGKRFIVSVLNHLWILRFQLSAPNLISCRSPSCFSFVSQVRDFCLFVVCIEDRVFSCIMELTMGTVPVSTAEHTTVQCSVSIPPYLDTMHFEAHYLLRYEAVYSGISPQTLRKERTTSICKVKE